MQVPNYNESSIAGSRHTRCNGVNVLNPFKQNPTIIFQEETVFVMDDDDYVTRPAGNINVRANMDTVLDDGEGNTISYAELYKWMYLAYLKEAVARDELKAKSDKATQLQAEVQEMYNNYVEEYWDNPEYEQVDFGEFYAKAIESEEISYDDLVESFRKPVEEGEAE